MLLFDNVFIEAFNNYGHISYRFLVLSAVCYINVLYKFTMGDIENSFDYHAQLTDLFALVATFINLIDCNYTSSHAAYIR